MARTGTNEGRSLAGKLALRFGLLVAAIALAAGVGAAGLLSMQSRLVATDRSHTLVRLAYEVGHHAAMAKQAVTSGDRAASAEHARRIADTCARLLDAAPPDAPAHARVAELAASATRLAEAVRAGSAPPAREAEAALAAVASLAGLLNAEIVETQRAAERDAARSLALLIGVSAVTIAAAAWLGVRQHRSVMRPIRSLQNAASRMSAGDLAARAESSGDRELRELAGGFNRMADDLERLYDSLRRQVEAKSRQLVRSEQLAVVGQLAAGVAHEINNPLGVALGYAESAQRALDAGRADSDERVREALPIIVEEVLRCRAITESLLTLARPLQRPQPVDVPAVCRRVARVLGGLPRFAGRTVEVESGGEDLFAAASPEHLTQVMTNLVANALESVDAGAGRVAVRVTRAGGWVRMAVADNGRGVEPEMLAKLFEPFYTDKPDRGERGVGLGLTVCHALVTRMGGRIDAASEGPGRGCVLTVDLPESAEHAEREAAATMEAAP